MRALSAVVQACRSVAAPSGCGVAMCFTDSVTGGIRGASVRCCWELAMAPVVFCIVLVYVCQMTGSACKVLFSMAGVDTELLLLESPPSIPSWMAGSRV